MDSIRKVYNPMESKEKVTPSQENHHRIKHYGHGRSRRNLLFTMLSERGWPYVLKKSFYKFGFPLVRPLVKQRVFLYQEKFLQYCNHNKDTAHATERTIEIPIVQWEIETARKELGREPRILEVGNVISHYAPEPYWDIVDKYEVGPNVLNEDIIEYNPLHRYDIIVSISTIEHIGFDEEEKEPKKIQQSLNHIINDLLRDDGRLIVTFPLGWNPNLDNEFKAGHLPFDITLLFRKKGWTTNWEQISHRNARYYYGKFVGADYLVVGLLRKSVKSNGIKP